MTLAYVESSALMKLVVREAESEALRRDLGGTTRLVSSQLSVLEVGRGAARADGDDGLARARATLLRFDLIPIDAPVVDTGTALLPRVLRSLDAIHVASALAIGVEHVVFYSYDARTLEAARANGLATASPGAA
jgi:predicted nucleic acid-binding protein